MKPSNEPSLQARQLLTCCLIGLFCFFSSYMRLPVLPLFAASLGADPRQVGMINAAFMIAAGLLAIPSGLLADRIGTRPMLLTGLLILSLSSFLIPLSPNPMVMGAIYLFFGAGLAAFTPTMMSFVADITPRTHLGRAYSFYTSAVYLGMTFGPAAGGFICHKTGLQAVFYISGGMIFLVFLFTALFLKNMTTHDQAIGARRPIIASLMDLTANRRLTAVLLGTIGGCFGFGMFISFLPLFAMSEGLDAGRIGMIFACQAMANVVLRIPFGRLSDRSDKGTMAFAGLLLFSAALAFTGWKGSFPHLAGSALLIGTGMGFGFTALGALVAEAVAPAERSLALGLYNSCIYLGMMLSSATMGSIIASLGYRKGFMLSGLLTALTAAAFILLFKKSSPAFERSKTE